MDIESVIQQIEKIKMELQASSFTIKELEDLRREVYRLESLIFTKIQAASSGIVTAAPKGIFECSMCGMEFMSKRSINAHIIRHHHLRPDDDYIIRR